MCVCVAGGAAVTHCDNGMGIMFIILNIKCMSEW